MAFAFQRRYEARVEERRGRSSGRYRKKIGDGSPRWKRRGWVMAGSNMSPRSWDVRREPSNGESTNWINCLTTRLRDGCGIGAAVEKKSRVRAGPRTMLFDTIADVVRLMRRTSTTTGLRTTVNVMRRVDQTGREVADNFKTDMAILFDELLPKWNYVAKPNNPDSC